MNDPIIMQTSALSVAMAVLLAMLVCMRRSHATVPQYFGSVGWHGGKKKR